jgi:hypothetical protein
MKKKYIIPTLQPREIQTEHLIAESLIEHTEGSDGGVLVKEDRSAGRSRGERSDYDKWNNVWNDIVNP